MRRWQFPSDLAPAVCALASCLWHLTFLSFLLPWKGLSRKSALPSSCPSVIDLATRLIIIRLSEISACPGTLHFWNYGIYRVCQDLLSFVPQLMMTISSDPETSCKNSEDMGLPGEAAEQVEESVTSGTKRELYPKLLSL